MVVSETSTEVERRWLIDFTNEFTELLNRCLLTLSLTTYLSDISVIILCSCDKLWLHATAAPASKKWGVPQYYGLKESMEIP